MRRPRPADGVRHASVRPSLARGNSVERVPDLPLECRSANVECKRFARSGAASFDERHDGAEVSCKRPFVGDDNRARKIGAKRSDERRIVVPQVDRAYASIRPCDENPAERRRCDGVRDAFAARAGTERRRRHAERLCFICSAGRCETRRLNCLGHRMATREILTQTFRSSCPPVLAGRDAENRPKQALEMEAAYADVAAHRFERQRRVRSHQRTRPGHQPLPLGIRRQIIRCTPLAGAEPCSLRRRKVIEVPHVFLSWRTRRTARAAGDSRRLDRKDECGAVIPPADGLPTVCIHVDHTADFTVASSHARAESCFRIADDVAGKAMRAQDSGCAARAARLGSGHGRFSHLRPARRTIL